MLDLLPLVVADPSLPERDREQIARSPEDAQRVLVQLGLDCREAADLAGIEPSEDCG